MLPDLEVVVLVLRGGRRDGGDAEEDVRVGLGQSVHDDVALFRLARGGGGQRVLAPAQLRQPGQPEVHLLRRDGRGGSAEELASLEVGGIVAKKTNVLYLLAKLVSEFMLLNAYFFVKGLVNPAPGSVKPQERDHFALENTLF